jgi:hypothetical protein
VNYEHQNWSETIAFEELCASIKTPNFDRFRAASSALKRLEYWPAVWERLSQLRDVEDSFRKTFRALITSSGFHFRESVRDSTIMIRAFRHLLPPYSGSARQLFRGEIASKHEQRDYGFSWTPLLATARIYADRRRTLDNEPGVVLETIAPSEAIISGPDSHSIGLGEHEYIVDPRALRDIQVIA